jgi:O-antigen ligase
MPGPATLYFRSDDGLRLSPFFKDPNVYAPYLGSGLILLGGTVVAGTTRLLPGFVGLAVIWIPMFFAFSRAAWLSIAVSAAVFGLLMLLVTRHRGPARRLLIIALGSMLVILPATLVVLLQVDLLQFFEDRLRWQSYDSARFATHATALTVALDNPIGIGPGHFVGRLHFPDSEFDIATHNVYLKVWAENGLVGLTTYLLILLVVIGSLLRAAFRRSPRYPIQLALVACLVGMMVNGYFIDTLHWRHLFVILGFSLSEIYVYERSHRLQASHALSLP